MSSNLSLPATIPSLMSEAARRWPDVVAIDDGPLRLTYAELDTMRWRATRALMSLGVLPGDRVAIWAPNVWEWIVAALAIHSAGAVLVPVNTRMRGNEAGDILNDSGARVLFCIGDFLGAYYPDLLGQHRPATLEHIIVLRAGNAWESFLERAETVSQAQALRRADTLAADDLSDLMFTSGTTGRPKGVMTAHGQNLRAVASWGNAVGLIPGERYLVVGPFFHAFGYKAGWLAALMHGVTILPQLIFDAERVLQRIANERINVLPGPPTLYHSILAHPRLAEFDLSSLRAAITGAASIPPVLIERMRRELGFKIVLTGYGLTESCGFATLCQPNDDADTIASTCGRAIPGIELRCIDTHGQPVGPGVTGEVVIRGYNVMRGYFNDDMATREAIDADGWLHTGDVGMLDEHGYLRITDRLKDMYISGGFNCYPAEIERLLSAHPDIAQVAVVGVPDERMGEVGKAYVVLRNDRTLNSPELIVWARERMANYKVPSVVEVLQELPTNAAGKVLKHQLR
ncbi:FadD3 family acyl-CoA ligase [Herbaspirillum sp. GCM10030257]|uniref:FadD3 family acyl-CoA ligase n=1 Tax=Herbaspirillum sp. GCM10030257 TaxID=3273393 RepID=UPI00362193F5